MATDILVRNKYFYKIFLSKLYSFFKGICGCKFEYSLQPHAINWQPYPIIWQPYPFSWQPYHNRWQPYPIK